jgi:hypothetical protein
VSEQVNTISQDTQVAWDALRSEGIEMPSVRQVYERRGGVGTYSRVTEECRQLRAAQTAAQQALPGDVWTQVYAEADSLATALEPIANVLAPFLTLQHLARDITTAMERERRDLERLQVAKATLLDEVAALEAKKTRLSGEVDSAVSARVDPFLGVFAPHRTAIAEEG